MIKLTLKYLDEDEPRIITIKDSFIIDEKQFVDWILNFMWKDCYLDEDIKSKYYGENDWLCDSYFDLLYKGYNVLDWYNGDTGWENTDDSFVTIEVI